MLWVLAAQNHTLGSVWATPDDCRTIVWLSGRTALNPSLLAGSTNPAVTEVKTSLIPSALVQQYQ